MLGAHSVSQLEKDDIDGVPSFDARLGAVIMHAKLSVLQHYRRTRSVRFAALIRDARGPPVFVGPYTSAAHSPVGWRTARREPRAAQGPRTRAQARARGGCGGTSRPNPNAPHRVEWFSETIGVRWPLRTSAAGLGTASTPPGRTRRPYPHSSAVAKLSVSAWEPWLRLHRRRAALAHCRRHRPAMPRS